MRDVIDAKLVTKAPTLNANISTAMIVAGGISDVEINGESVVQGDTAHINLDETLRYTNGQVGLAKSQRRAFLTIAVAPTGVLTPAQLELLLGSPATQLEYHGTLYQLATRSLNLYQYYTANSGAQYNNINVDLNTGEYIFEEIQTPVVEELVTEVEQLVTKSAEWDEKVTAAAEPDPWVSDDFTLRLFK